MNILVLESSAIIHQVRLMAYVHRRTRIKVPTWIRITKAMATLYCAVHVYTAQTWIQIAIQTPFPNHYCTQFWDGYPYPNGDVSMASKCTIKVKVFNSCRIRIYLVTWTELIHGTYLSLIESLTKHIYRRHLSAEHCVDIHITCSTNVTLVERL